MYPKARLDALTDGIFAVAMTLLVLELRVPDQPVADSAALWQALKDLWPKFSELSRPRQQLAVENPRPHGGRTCDPHLCDLLAPKPAACHLRAVLDHAGRALCRCAARDLIYVGNLGLNGVTALAMVTSMREAHQASAERRGGVTVLIISCVVAAIIAVFAPQQALWALMLNALPILASRKSRPRLVKQARDALFFGRTRDRLADERPDR
jgi:hypothetical protein